MFTITLLLSMTLAQERYEYVPMQFKQTTMIIDDYKSYQYVSGYINHHGIFVIEKVISKAEKQKDRLPPISTPQSDIVSRKKPSVVGLDSFNVPLLNEEQVYEFRAGMLIPGYLTSYKFTPEEGGRIIKFSEYVYAPHNRRIYNLPGKFVKASEAEAERQKVAAVEKAYREGK